MGKNFMGYNNASELITAIGNKIKAKYTKPNTGIPKSDLASGVQTSLGRADSALQSETDPTVPSWAKQTNKPSYTQDEVTDGTTYKRVTQTEKNAWSGKQNALTTTQMQAVNSGINSTKVDQISTNQSNILSVRDKIGRNFLNVTTLKRNTANWGKSILVGGVRFTLNDDNTITVNRESSSSEMAYVTLCIDNSIADFDAKPYCNNNYYLIGCPEGGSADSYSLYAAKSTYAKYDYGNGALLPTTGVAAPIYINIRVAASYNIQNKVFKPMIITKEDYDAGLTTYQPYGAPNYDLTRLEAEDRAALAEDIDDGAKNKCALDKTYIVNNNANGTWSGDSYTVSGVTFAFNFTNGTIACSGTASASIFLVLSNDIANYTGKEMAISGCPSGGNYDTGYSLYVVDTSETTILKDIGSGATFTVPNNVKRLKIGVRSGTNMASKTFYPMICTKAAFGVSQKFVPYRFPITGVYSVIQKLVACSTTETTTGIKFTSTESACYRISVTAMYSASKPLTLRVKQKTNSSDTFHYFLGADSVTNAAISVSGIMKLGIGGEFEVFAKYEAAADNHFYVMVEKIG